MATDPLSTASSWLSTFSSALGLADLDKLSGLFLPNGWFRDLLVFTWDVRSMEGRDKIQSFLAPTLSKACIDNVKLEDGKYLVPHKSFLPLLQAEDIEFGFSFDCSRGRGEGYARLLPDRDHTYRALTVFMMLSDLRGHEEINTLVLRDDLTGIPGRDMQQEFAKYVTQVETDPYVLISMLCTYLKWMSLICRRLQSGPGKRGCISPLGSSKWISLHL